MWAIYLTHLLQITSNMSTSFSESERCSKLRSITWGRKWLPWGLSAVRIASVEVHTRVVTPSAFYPRTFCLLSKVTLTQPSSIMESKQARRSIKCSVHKAHIVSIAVMEVEVVHTQVALTVQANIIKESRVSKKRLNHESLIITFNSKMYAQSLVVNRTGKLVLELVASRRIKGRHLICTYREQVSLKWAERDRMNLFIATTLAIVRYLPINIRNGNEEALVMNWIKVIATASSTVLSYQTITMT